MNFKRHKVLSPAAERTHLAFKCPGPTDNQSEVSKNNALPRIESDYSILVINNWCGRCSTAGSFISCSADLWAVIAAQISCG